MATNNFTAASGEWNTAGNWSLGHVPNSDEDTTFTGLDGSGALTITPTNALAKSVDFSTAGAGFTLTGTNIQVYGGLLKNHPDMTWTSNIYAYIRFVGGGTIDANGAASINRNIVCGYASAGTLTLLNNDVDTGAGNIYTGVAGSSLTTNNLDISCAIFGDNSIAGAVTLTLGSSTINCTNVSFAASTLTVTANTAAINITSTADITANFGGQTWGGTTTVLMTGGKVFTLNGANTFDKFAISWTTASLVSALKLGANQTFSNATSDAFKFTGSATIARPTIKSTVDGTQRTITAATTNITGAIDFRDIVGAGAGSWDLSAIASGNFGGNNGITLRTPATYYAKTLTANRNWVDNIWSTSETGATADGSGVFPLPQDTVVINDYTGDNSNKVLYFNDTKICNVDASSITETLTIKLGYVSYFGDLILTGANLTIQDNSYVYSFSGSVKNSYSDTLDINIPYDLGGSGLNINSYGGTVRLLTNGLTHTGDFTLTRGKFDRNGQTLSTNIFSSSNTNTRTLQDSAGGGKIITKALTGTVFDMSTTTNLTVSNAPDIEIGTGALTQTADVTFAGGGKAFGDFTVKKHAGNFDCIVTGDNTFGAVTLETPDATYQYSDAIFPLLTSTTVTSFTADGTADYPIAFSGDFDDASGTNTVSYCVISNSDVSGGAIWDASNNCTDGLGNTGWDFVSGGSIPVFHHYYNHMRA